MSGFPKNDSRDSWELDLTRGVRTKLTSEPGRELYAAWSPSGGEIAYSVFVGKGGNLPKAL